MLRIEFEQGQSILAHTVRNCCVIDKIIEEALVTIDTQKRIGLYDEFQKLVAADLPLINVADWGFTSVVSVDVLNVGNNPRWVVSNWADTEIAA